MPLLLDLFCGAGPGRCMCRGMELSQSIPPAYTRYLGDAMMAAL